MFLEDKKLQLDAESSHFSLFFNLFLCYIHSSNGLAENTDFDKRVSMTTHTKSFSRGDSSKDCWETNRFSLLKAIYMSLIILNAEYYSNFCYSLVAQINPQSIVQVYLGRQIGELDDLKLVSRTPKTMGYSTFINKPPFSMTGLPIFLHSPTLKNRLHNFQMGLPCTGAMLKLCAVFDF